jgi:heme exporter protein A
MRLVAEELAVERGGRLLFSGLSFSVAAGEALALRGPNGAGKTTLLRVLGGLAQPLTGRMRLEGAVGAPGAACHLLAVENAMKPALTVEENLRFWRRFLLPAETGGGEDLMPRAALEAVGLAALAGLPFGVLSTGQKRRVGLARLLLRHRPVWLLDEPASGLDAASEAMLGRLVEAHLAGGGLVVAALHGRPSAAFGQEFRIEEPA